MPAHPFRVVGVAAIVAAAAVGQGFPQWQVAIPTTTADGFGSAVAIVGDEDGDGIRDVFVGAPSVPGAFTPSPSTYAMVLSGSNAAVIHSWTGAFPTDQFGFAVADVGDLDFDGLSDVAIGAPGPGGPNSPGTVRIFSGASGALIRTIAGGPAGDQLGAALASGADYDQDGIPDVLVGAPVAGAGTGRVFAYSGASGALLRTFSVANSERLGLSVADAGDVDLDGVGDVIAGAPGSAFLLQISLGSAHVLSGATSGVIRTMTGSIPSGLFGYSVAALGDVTGDGVPDFAIGVPLGTLASTTVTGRVELRSGATGSLVFGLAGATRYESFGLAVANAGDLDGDGRSDFFVGVPGRLVGNANCGVVTAYSSVTAAIILDVRGSLPNGGFGSAVAAGLDATGDGVADVAIGVPGNLIAMPTGRATLVSPVGVGAGLSPYGAACPGAGGFAPQIAAFGGPPALGNATFGISVARGLGGTAAYLFASGASAPQGFPVGGGCSAWIGTPFSQVAALVLSGHTGDAGAGHGTFFAPVPNAPLLVGATFYLEWALIDSASPTGVVALSDALVVTVF